MADPRSAQGPLGPAATSQVVASRWPSSGLSSLTMLGPLSTPGGGDGSAVRLILQKRLQGGELHDDGRGADKLSGNPKPF